MDVYEYNGIIVNIEQNAVVSQNAWSKFLFNAWNYTNKSENAVKPEAFFTVDNSKEFQSFSFISHSTNFGWLSSLATSKDQRNEKINVLDSLKNSAKINKESLVKK